MADDFDIEYSKTNGGSLLRTGGRIGGGGDGTGGGGFGFSGSGSATMPGMPDMTEFYRAMAERQAEKENYRRQQEQEAIARQQENQDYQRRMQRGQMAEHRGDMMSAHNERNRERSEMMNAQMRQQGDPGAQATRWQKYLPGIGPVDVAEGTFGAQAVGNINAGTQAYENSIGLKPGAVGGHLGYGTAGVGETYSGNKGDQEDQNEMERQFQIKKAMAGSGR